MRLNWKRKKFLINYKVQLNILFKVSLLFVVFVAALITVFYTYYANVTSPENLRDLSFSDQAVAKEVLFKPLGDIAFYYGLLAAAFLFFLCIYLTILTHRMTGPIYKMNKILRHAIDQKEWPGAVRFRKNDSFTELATNFNEFVEAMKSRGVR